MEVSCVKLSGGGFMLAAILTGDQIGWVAFNKLNILACDIE